MLLYIFVFFEDGDTCTLYQQLSFCLALVNCYKVMGILRNFTKGIGVQCKLCVLRKPLDKYMHVSSSDPC